MDRGQIVASTWRTWAAAALVVTLLATIPIRAQRDIGEANLEHLGIGLSHWHPDKDGVEYRLAGVSSIVFVPSSATVVEIPLRAVSSEIPLRIAIQLDGRPADEVTVRSDTWHTLVLQVPHQRDDKRFRALGLRVVNGPATAQPDLLMIGKVRPRGPLRRSSVSWMGHDGPRQTWLVKSGESRTLRVAGRLKPDATTAQNVRTNDRAARRASTNAAVVSGFSRT